MVDDTDTPDEVDFFKRIDRIKLKHNPPPEPKEDPRPTPPPPEVREETPRRRPLRKGWHEQLEKDEDE